MAITLIAAAIATLDPEIAPKSTHASTVATPNPPGSQPTSASAKRKSCVTSPVLLHEEAREDEERDRHQGIAADEVEERSGR